ncbi:MAG: flagellar basal body L-ring protein FlgH, partial [Pseudomonadales bacterium]
TSVAQDRSFDGSGEADQQNSLSGNIAVTVSGVLPNGLLVIRGEKWMTLTTGQEFIRLKGLIRPDDISSSNTVPSTKVADARITYSGTGELADASRQGWGSRFFNSRYWPF